jgi:hypothetical protein
MVSLDHSLSQNHGDSGSTNEKPKIMQINKKLLINMYMHTKF